ncbi:succinate dehydrogenase iron-sulfur subunit [Carboxydochorda subterranea]|uniref:Fumarate reductase iron-sulfur subunit n=1 Tax=Carboxydichorda subterranea TaxID=3109565 RepID=A0ABZ1BZ29_9FIRM|nr:succinate dehydrogenase iron-sulfur subunit [Limnochorda sp. L945t]WRP18057.1 succinate dehydrogenase iron-sulfur subunit [Limnochorda sp. L945t]
MSRASGSAAAPERAATVEQEAPSTPAAGKGTPKAAGSVTLRVARFDPYRDTELHWQTYQVPTVPGMTVLDALFSVKEHQDGSLAFRSSCRMGVCGSCGMFINGKPRLACQTQVVELGDTIEVAPLPNHDVIRDLVPDLTPTFEKHRAVKPYLIRQDGAEMEAPTREFRQTPEEMEAYLQFAYCLKCSLCVAACPTVATDPHFLGPQALAQAYRYTADSRDGGWAERLPVLDTTHGVYECHLAGACSEACPKGVDPAFGIQLLKRTVVRGGPDRAPAPVMGPLPPPSDKTPDGKPRLQAPPPTV